VGDDACCIILLWASMPAAMSMASTGLFELMIRLPAGPPPGSQGPGPSQVDRTSSHGGSGNGQLGLQLPSIGLPCSVMLCPPLPSGGHALAHFALAPFLDSASISCPALPTSQVNRVFSYDTSHSSKLGSCLWVRSSILSVPLSPPGASACG